MMAGKDDFGKGGFEMSFAWIFAMIVGAVILFLALFFVSNIITTSEYEVTTETAKSITNIFDALQTKSESTKINSVNLAKESRIYTSCEDTGYFGENKIAISEKSSFKGKEWTDIGGDISIQNQYIFADDVIEGKKLYFIVMPFEMPFKIGDVMIVHTQQYCFVSPPNKIEDDIENIIESSEEQIKDTSNIVIVNSISNCSEESINICFDENVKACDVIVKGTCLGGLNCESLYDTGNVFKNNKRFDYIGRQLLYGAIFSDKSNYECNVKRFMMRLELLGDIYVKKVNFLNNDCGINVQREIAEIKSLAENYENSDDLINIKLQADRLDESNSICEIY